MGNVFAEIPPPSYWQDFELLTLDLCRKKWGDDYAERNGREGQSQSGVDVFGYNYGAKEQTGVQCKKRKTKLNGVAAPSSSLTTLEIDAEISFAKSFSPDLNRFVIATTGPRDTHLQEYVRLYNHNGHAMKVSLWFWDDYVEALNSNVSLMYRYYDNVLKYRQRYSEDEHYLQMLVVAFDRPAIRTAFHLENRATDFIEAISLLQQAVTTGVLKDKSGHVIDQCRVPKTTSAEIKDIKKKLQSIRAIATEGINTGRIIEHQTVIEILDRSLQDQLNKLRKDVVEKLNALLKPANIEEIEIREY
ncbi:hypothetical protein NBV64_00050 [Alcaligenes sp. DN25]|uniref:hypothetical protein n=1 Tax=Alcaligenes TaxID=507 RepID=UPI00202F3B4E|nr:MULTISPECIES: hypothetical protein [Alcaligenes]URW82793.1 hypothetical protein NBV64_00050 [Alcaligenes sp. DN25]WEA67620.1 hypothetical protein PWH35_00050 [Alcaligenes faecalis]